MYVCLSTYVLIIEYAYMPAHMYVCEIRFFFTCALVAFMIDTYIYTYKFICMYISKGRCMFICMASTSIIKR